MQAQESRSSVFFSPSQLTLTHTRSNSNTTKQIDSKKFISSLKPQQSCTVRAGSNLSKFSDDDDDDDGAEMSKEEYGKLIFVVVWHVCSPARRHRPDLL